MESLRDVIVTYICVNNVKNDICLLQSTPSSPHLKRSNSNTEYQRKVEMASLNANNVNRPIDPIRPESLPDASHNDVAKGLSAVVEHSADNANVAHHIHTPIHMLVGSHWIQSLIPGIEKLAVDYHCGNYVVVRGSDEPFFETMPLYARWVKHSLFFILAMGNDVTIHLGLVKPRDAPSVLRKRTSEIVG